MAVARRPRLLFSSATRPRNRRKRRISRRGINAGQRAVAAESNAVEGHFWLRSITAVTATRRGVFKALPHRQIFAPRWRRFSLNIQDGGAYLALGEMDRQCREIIGGNMNRAIQRLEQGVRVAPHIWKSSWRSDRLMRKKG